MDVFGISIKAVNIHIFHKAMYHIGKVNLVVMYCVI